MKEYTVVYKAEITEIIKAEYLPEHMVNPEDVGKWIKSKLNVDDAKAKNVKVFEREV